MKLGLVFLVFPPTPAETGLQFIADRLNLQGLILHSLSILNKGSLSLLEYAMLKTHLNERTLTTKV